MRLARDRAVKALNATTVFRTMTFLMVVACIFLVLDHQTILTPATASTRTVTQGALTSVDADGQPQQPCPLKHTDVKIEVSAFLARATVTQQFENPLPDKIEAVYTFPLPRRAAVDDMTITVGDRVVKGKIKTRDEARAVYEAARSKGQVAALLDQERPNIFTQSVTNIMPGEKVMVTISYVETLLYKDGAYELVFPMVVGPRYIPGQAIGRDGGGMAPDTEEVPDASRITPQITPEGTRAGHDIALDVTLDAGVEIHALRSPSHEVETTRPGATSAHVRLKNAATIPNKDFILTYDVAGAGIEDAVLTHKNGETGFFTLILQPPQRVTAETVAPKELVFVLDTSGSMRGFKIEKAKEAMQIAMEGLYSEDRFNFITFSGDTHVLFPEPVPATEANVQKALAFLGSREGRGGTEMMKAIRAALEPSGSRKHVRIVCFMTDGLVGNDMAIIDEIQRHPNARVFAFGIGNSVNRFLLDKMAEHGRGEVEYVGLQDDGSAAAQRFHERVRNPLLTDITVDWGDLRVEEVYPEHIPDLFAAKPLVLTGQYRDSADGHITLTGLVGGHTHTRRIDVSLPAHDDRHDVLATLWARTKIGHLMAQDYYGMQRRLPRPEVAESITKLGLQYRILTQFTSFVAVEEMTITEGGEPRRIEVPVEMPDGVTYEGIFGKERKRAVRSASAAAGSAPAGKYLGLGRSLESFGGCTTCDVGGSVSARRGQAESLSAKTRPATKLDAKLATILVRVQQRSDIASLEEEEFVKDGKALVQIWLTNTSSLTIAKLKKLGLEVLLEPTGGKVIIGRIPLEQLEALIKLESVTHVAPFTIKS